MPKRQHSTTLSPLLQFLTFFLPHSVNLSANSGCWYAPNPRNLEFFFNVPISQSRLFPQAPQTPSGSHSKTLFQEQGTAAFVINTMSTWKGPKACLLMLSPWGSRPNHEVTMGRQEQELCWKPRPGLPARGSQRKRGWDTSEKLQGKLKEGYHLVLCLIQMQTLHSIHKRQIQWPSALSPVLLTMTITPIPGIWIQNDHLWSLSPNLLHNGHQPCL